MRIYKIFLHSFQFSVTPKTDWMKGLAICDIPVKEGLIITDSREVVLTLNYFLPSTDEVTLMNWAMSFKSKANSENRRNSGP